MKQTQDTPLILVADDEMSAAIMLKHIFEREKYRVQIASDGVEAFRLAQDIHPDLIILDIMMPEMNGFEVLQKLRDHPKTNGIPTIVVSAKAKEPSDVAKGLNIGADDYMSKPFAPQELLARARSKMKAKQLEETLQQRTRELEALLKVSEALNRHLEVEELMILVLDLTFELLHGEFTLIYRMDSDTSMSSHMARSRGIDIEDEFTEGILCHLEKHNYQFYDALNHEIGFEHVLLFPLDHGEQLLGIIMLCSNNQPYDMNHQMLFRGISRQAALALHNAELYEVQANYALHLEEMVAQRTEELKAAQQMLLRSEKLASIGHLAASIAHEINNPLQPIQLNLEFILEDVQAQNTIDAKLIEMTQNSVQRISRIVQQLLEFTKTGKDSTLIPVDLIPIIESVVKLNEKAFEQAKIQIQTNFDEIGQITGNRDQLEQVFMNLMINAKAAMKEGGKLHIRAWQEGAKLRIQFEDTGSGIPQNLLDKIFDPFMSTKPDGTGLGLFVTYGIVESHQGEIEVKSKEGEGTVFTLTFPAAN